MRWCLNSILGSSQCFDLKLLLPSSSYCLIQRLQQFLTHCTTRETVPRPLDWVSLFVGLGNCEGTWYSGFNVWQGQELFPFSESFTHALRTTKFQCKFFVLQISIISFTCFFLPPWFITMSLFTFFSVSLFVFCLLVFIYLQPFIYDFLKILLFPIRCIYLHSNS
jgi:hypothetical protein